MAIQQSIDSALERNIGPHGASDKALNAALERAEGALDALRKGDLPLLQLPKIRADLPALRDIAARLVQGATDIVLLGTGGSSLGGQTLAQLAGHAVPGVGSLRATPHLHFMDNLDGGTFEMLLKHLPHQTTRYVAVSKSGGTAETLMQTIAALTAVKAAGLETRIPDIFLGLTEPTKAGKRNGLRDLLGKYRVPVLDHHTGVGGRFSALTNVGLLPAALLGLDISAVREGAGLALAPVLAKKKAADVPAALGAALNVSLAATGKNISVLMAYADRLERFTHWYVQLWSESLGKNGKGTTPVAALAKLAGEPDFAGKTIGDLVAAEGRATAETLAKNGCPVRTINLARLDEESLGELLMHFMLETIIAAHLLGVDAFDQPAVEEGKVLAKKYLTGG
jgi:glucose-6-phosphate isomerase